MVFGSFSEQNLPQSQGPKVVRRLSKSSGLRTDIGAEGSCRLTEYFLQTGLVPTVRSQGPQVPAET